MEKANFAWTTTGVRRCLSGVFFPGGSGTELIAIPLKLPRCWYLDVFSISKWQDDVAKRILTRLFAP